VLNLLDTPGHKDFAEDTFRTLTAVDSVILVIDSVNGVEAQTRRLILAGIRRRISRPRSERPKAVIQPIRPSAPPAAATFIDSGLSRSRLVADATHGHHDLRMLGIPLDLGPEPLHVHVDKPGVSRMPVTPDLLK